MDLKQYRSKLIGSDEERAVSPVIGVILMVAITVILAAVIAAFVLDMGPGGESVQAGADISGDETDEVTISITDGGSADQVVIVNSSGGVEWADAANTGAEYNIEDTDLANTPGSATEYDVYGVSGNLAADDQLDDADGQVQIASFTLDP